MMATVPLSNAADWAGQALRNRPYEDVPRIRQEDEAIQDAIRRGVPIPRPRPVMPSSQGMPSKENLLIAAAIMYQQGKFVTDEQGQPIAEAKTIGDIARRWQGFESRFPKEQHNPPKDMMIVPQVVGKKGYT